ncbi:calcium-independent phospholipase A2-gamma-like isoform X1 [Xiphophorus couchianus]|uniref:calcium-independent phospholipase A2-gamma-like isoform X1 n=1 Tax=Xiphophorus couchianus TaxID=32473 RepID=UPI001016BB0A|nr:calcium-independent phospholipase A2-gamma-like isoform X1 [Xiphophorus couchianus]XP_027875529.1 calcium-independent phospholipase A2-gamma-like isoform X1 [Xiphophorus couchianus]XP_027875534.1 calcium-independent phospholipase A2-gamma-like isoform X1 [Xiphophorus couchianus]XP_027875544.1 calcium-independent phospholipase A2-gamma-like isoform X1 [Xiphophorus couchianus]
MGHPFCPVLCSGVAKRTLISCRNMYTMICLKRDQSLFRLALCPNSFRLYTFNSSAKLFTSYASIFFNLRYLCFYSFTNKEAFKTKAPVGIFNAPVLKSHPLSRHFNIYLKRSHVVGFAENGSFVATVPEYQYQSQKRRFSQWSAATQKKPGGSSPAQSSKSKEKQKEPETVASSDDKSELDLFHISSLATVFGETFDYVAKHVNSVFSLDETGQKKDLSSMSRRVKKKKKIPDSGEKPQVKQHIQQTTMEHQNDPNTSEELFPHTAEHINKYFGASDDVDEAHSDKELPVSTKPTSKAASLEDSYSQTSTHINQYFRSQSEQKDPNTKTDLASLQKTSLMDVFRHPTAAASRFLRSMFQETEVTPAVALPEITINNRCVLTRRHAEETTLRLILRLGQASTPDAMTACIEVLNEHLIRFPACKSFIWQGTSIVNLLRLRRTYKHHQGLQAAIREAFALIGYVDPVKGRGIRVLSIDGGGTRGVVPLQLLKILEDETGRKIYQLFDYICGVSTGAILAFMLGLARVSLEECTEMYRQIGTEVFKQNPLVGTVNMGWSHSYYDTATWEKILQETLGSELLIKTSRNKCTPKVAAISAVVNWGTGPKAFVFRNYSHKPGCPSRFSGGSSHKMWEAVRASSAAPGYFQEFLLQNDIHQDGGIIMNNPCTLAVHESRLMWPNTPFQCVLSLGTGRYDDVKRSPSTFTSLRANINNLIFSATDTEGVHTLLGDLLPPDVYFRFNPMMNADVSLDENHPETLDKLVTDTQDYLNINRSKVAKLCLVLSTQRSSMSQAKDWLSQRTWEIKKTLI